jgi:hypothetical protein
MYNSFPPPAQPDNAVTSIAEVAKNKNFFIDLNDLLPFTFTIVNFTFILQGL